MGYDFDEFGGDDQVDVSDFLVKEGGEVQWNKRLFKDLGVASDDNGVLLAVGLDDKTKDAVTGFYIIGENDGASVAGLLKVAHGKGDSACLPWFKDQYGYRAGKSKYSEILAKFKKYNADNNLITLVANNAAEMIEEFGIDESVKSRKIAGLTKWELMQKELDDLKKQIAESKNKE
jgi:hypothetical protein